MCNPCGHHWALSGLILPGSHSLCALRQIEHIWTLQSIWGSEGETFWKGFTQSGNVTCYLQTVPSAWNLHTESGSGGNFLPRRKRPLAWQHSQVSSAAQGITQGPVKCHSLTCTMWGCYHSSTGEPCLHTCLDVQLWDAFVPGWHQRRPETDGSTTQWGGTRVWAAEGMRQGWWPQTRGRMSQVLAGSTGTWWLRAGVSSPAAAAARASSLLQPGAAHSPPAFLQAGFS